MERMACGGLAGASAQVIIKTLITHTISSCTLGTFSLYKYSSCHVPHMRLVSLCSLYVHTFIHALP